MSEIPLIEYRIMVFEITRWGTQCSWGGKNNYKERHIIMTKPAKVEGGNLRGEALGGKLELEVENPRAPHPLYETLFKRCYIVISQ